MRYCTRSHTLTAASAQTKGKPISKKVEAFRSKSKAEQSNSSNVFHTMNRHLNETVLMIAQTTINEKTYVNRRIIFSIN